MRGETRCFPQRTSKIVWPHVNVNPPPSQAHYGKHDDASVAAVKALYVELDLEADFKAYEEASYKALQMKITQVDEEGTLPGDVFKGLLAKIYKREK